MKKLPFAVAAFALVMAPFAVSIASGSSRKPLTLIAVGDINLGDGVKSRIDRHGVYYPWKKTSNILKSADITFGNLECCVSVRGRPVAGKKYTFRGDPKSLKGLVTSGLDVVSLANNHSKDYGEVSLIDTLKNLNEHKIAQAGAGKLDRAYQPVLVKRKGITVAFLAFSDINPAGWTATKNHYGVAPVYPMKKVSSALAQARKISSIQVVSFHWGIELKTKPNAEQRRIARFAIDNGADIVLGHHPHVPQTVEWYKNKPIVYSLGNFVFSPGHEIATKSILVKLTVYWNGKIAIKSEKIKIVNCLPRIVR